jgi:hypothetical protein
MKYRDLETVTDDDIRIALEHGEVEDLLLVPIDVSMGSPDFEFGQQVCTRLATHADEAVRGNALEVSRI